MVKLTMAELRKLPLPTLRVIALAAARDVDAGQDEKRETLEDVIGIIVHKGERQ